MGQELITRYGYVCGTLSTSLDEDISECEKYISYLKKKIYTYMVMSPKTSKDSEGNKLSWPDFIHEVSDELFEELENEERKLARLYMAKDAVDQKTVKYHVCPKCRKYVDVCDEKCHKYIYDEKTKTGHMEYHCDCGCEDLFEIEVPAFEDSY